MCSMISAQCDRLRDRAEELRGLTPDPIVPNLVPSTKEIMAIAMGSAASEMCCAADTILELRNKLSGVVDQSEEVERLKAENAKLRELVRDMYGATLFLCGECWISGAFDPAGCDNENCGSRKNYLAMRELRIEADE